MSPPWAVSAQITEIERNTIAHPGNDGVQTNATSAHNTATITPTVRAHIGTYGRPSRVPQRGLPQDLFGRFYSEASFSGREMAYR
jgi:hypothetical protein